MIRTTDRIAHPSRADSAQAVAGLRRLVQSVSQDDIDFAVELEIACEEGGLDFAIAWAHAMNEADFLRDPDWTRSFNAFGIGHPDNAEWGVVFASPRACARFYVGEMLLKLRKPIPPSLADARTYAPATWDAVERVVGGSLGPFPAVARIADLNKRFGPNDREAVWMTDRFGPAAIVNKGEAIFDTLPDQEDTPPMPKPRPVILLDAGHRSTDRSGNPAEMSMTDDLARAYREELRGRGYEAFWFQEDIDRDSDPDETIGDLNTVAKGLGAWLRGQPWAVLLSLHYNGPHSKVHAIVPDNVGLSTAYPEGRDAADTAANNALDRELAQAITERMWGAGLGLLFLGKLGVAGLMSETETGVGLDGYRLAVFAATAPARQTAVRLVIEHGGTADPAAQRFIDFSRAAADAIDAVYGQSEPAPPPPIWPAKPIPAPDELRAQGHVLTALTERRITATQGGTFRTAPHRDAPAIAKPPYKAGRPYTFAFRATVDGADWYVSSRGSWAPARNFGGD